LLRVRKDKPSRRGTRKGDRAGLLYLNEFWRHMSWIIWKHFFVLKYTRTCILGYPFPE
jgi:hypothetical protein